MISELDVLGLPDNTPPTISNYSVDPPALFPPNHTMRDVTVNYDATDNCGTPDCALTVSSNEPVNGLGDGDTAPDWEIVDAHHVRLRAERAGNGNGRVYTITITCTDSSGNVATQNVTVNVAHNITGPPSGAAFKVGTTVKFAGQFWDIPGAKHTAQWTFDTVTQAGTVVEPTSSKPGSVSGAYTFTAAGVYLVKLTVTDSRGLSDTSTMQGDIGELVVIYDPKAGYVLGSGSFDSPAGAFTSNPSLAGKAGFGFVSQYFKAAPNPKGNTAFNLKIAGLEFVSLNYSYLAVSGARAQYKGFGKINGDASYNFILTVLDGQAAGGGGVDKLRMKIWNKNTGAVVYDSQPGAPDNADPSTPVASGSAIQIQY
jgi:PKD repeat protein